MNNDEQCDFQFFWDFEWNFIEELVLGFLGNFFADKKLFGKKEWNFFQRKLKNFAKREKSKARILDFMEKRRKLALIPILTQDGR